MFENHIRIQTNESELYVFLTQLKAYGLCLGSDKEIEGSVVDVVGDRRAELLHGLTAEDDVKSGFLSCGDYLADWGAHTEFRVGIHHESYIDVLS